VLVGRHRLEAEHLRLHRLLEVYHQRLSQAENTLNKIDSQPFSNNEEKVKYLELIWQAFMNNHGEGS
jgi:hypothetical protein